MYVALMSLRIDPEKAPQAASACTTKILPAVKQLRGFVKGYWVDPNDGRGFGFVLFDTEAEAMEGTKSGVDWSAPGVTVESVEIRRLAVEA